MSLISVAQTVADEVGLPTPTAIIGSPDRTAKQLLRLINRTGKNLAKRNWTVLQKEHTFSTVASTASYSLPSDFERLLDFTMWDRTQYWSLRGPRSPQEWQRVKSGLVAPSIRSGFRIKADTRVNKYFLDPTPSSALDMVFEYASSQWVMDSGNTLGRTYYAADSDVSLINEELIEMGVIWRLLDRKGFAYAEARDEWDREVDRAFAEDGGAEILNMGGPRRLEFPANIREGGFG